MLIDKLEGHFTRRNLGEEETYSIIDPMAFLDDIYTNLSLKEKIEPTIRVLYDDIVNMDGYIAAQAPVITISGQSGNIRLRKSDIKMTVNGTDDGLSNVDNTPDLSKPASKFLMDRWEKDKIPNYIMPGYNIMRSWVDPYVLHITGYQNGPLRGNPHRVTLASGIYYTDKDGVESIVTVLPQSFLHNGDPIGILLKKWIDEHNIDVNPLVCHVPIWSRVRTSIGVEPNGDVRQNAINFNIRLTTYDTGNTLDLRIRDYATPSVTLHENNQLDSHQNYRDAIIDMIDDPHVVYSDTSERVMYEYLSWKRQVNLLTTMAEYTKEYPTTLSVLRAILERKPGLTTNNSVGQLISDFAKAPYLHLDNPGQKMTLLTSNNTMHSWYWPARLTPWFLGLDNDNENVSDITLSGPVFRVFAKPNILAWKNSNQGDAVAWNQFQLAMGPPVDKRNMTIVKYYDYTPLPANFKGIIDDEFPTIWSAILIAPYSIILRQKGYNIFGVQTGDRYNATLTIKDRKKIDGLLFQTAYSVNHDRRIFVLNTPSNAASADTVNVIGSSYDYYPTEETVVAAKNKDFGSSERPAQITTINKTTTAASTNSNQGRINIHDLSIANLDMTSIFNARITAAVQYQQGSVAGKTQGAITTDFYVINSDNSSKYKWNGTSWVTDTGTPISVAYTFTFSFLSPPAQATAAHDMNWGIDRTITPGDLYNNYEYTYQSNKSWNINSKLLYT